MISVYGINEQLNPIKDQLSGTIHQVMQTVLGLPEDKKIQRFFPMELENFYRPAGRTEQYTMIEINLMAGRQRETIKQLIKTLFEKIEQELHIAPIDIEITVHQQPKHCWGFRGITGDEAADLKYKVEV